MVLTALALALALVILHSGGEGDLGGGVIEIFEGGGVMETSDLAGGERLKVTSDRVLAGVMQREAADCDKDEEIMCVAMSQSPLTHLNLMGGSMKLSGLRILFLLTSASQDSSV